MSVKETDEVVTFTEGAKAHVVAFLAEESEPLSVRIEVLDSSPLAPRYHLSLIERQRRRDGDGFIVTNPNCATVGLVLGLKPLADAFGIGEIR